MGLEKQNGFTSQFMGLVQFHFIFYGFGPSHTNGFMNQFMGLVQFHFL
jgi:hypothetical protein